MILLYQIVQVFRGTNIDNERIGPLIDSRVLSLEMFVPIQNVISRQRRAADRVAQIIGR